MERNPGDIERNERKINKHKVSRSKAECVEFHVINYVNKMEEVLFGMLSGVKRQTC
jgi:hypothetical protein